MFEQAEPVFRNETISSQSKTISDDSTIIPWERITVSIEDAIESIKAFNEALRNLPQSIGVVKTPANIEFKNEKKIQPIPCRESVESIKKVNISDGDTIIITYDIRECDMEEIKMIHDMYREAFPNNNIVSQIFPAVKDITVLHREH